MAYVAPTWRNGGPPALDAAALQAISDAIVGAESKNASQDTAISTLQTTVAGKGQVAIGSYVGTGTLSSSTPTRITFPFPPKLIIIQSSFGKSAYVQFGVWVQGMSYIGANAEYSYNTATLSGNVFTFYGENSTYSSSAFNLASTTYYYIGIG